MMKNLMAKFRRDTSPLKVPTAMADGITHGPGGTWAWVELPGQSTDEVNTSTMFDLTSRGADDLRRLIPAGAEFHFKIQWGKWSGEDYYQDQAKPHMTQGALNFVDLGARRIDQWKFSRRMVLLGVRFDGQETVLKAATEGTKKAMGVFTAQQSAEKSLAADYKKIQAWIGRMADSSFRAKAATTQQLSWSLARDLRRTVDWVPSDAIADAGQVVRLKSTNVTPHRTHVTIKTSKIERHIRIVVPSEKGFPTSELSLPGGEWLKNLNIVNLDSDDETCEPVEVSIRGRNYSRTETLARLKMALSVTKEQDREARAGWAGEAPDAVDDAGQVLRERVREVQKGLIGMIGDTPAWVVEADDLATLDLRVEKLIDFYGGLGITVWAPADIQDLLWKELIIGDTQRVREFEQYRPTSTLVGAWFHGGSEVGSASGSYLAANTGSTPGPYKSRITDAAKTRDAVTVGYSGTTGSGKSTAVCLTILSEVIVQDAWAILPDVKGDLDGICEVAEMFDVNVTKLSTADQASGTICPFRYVSDPMEAASMVVDNLAMMLARTDDKMESQIRYAANQVALRADSKERSTAMVIDLLVQSDDPEVAGLGATLGQLAKDPLAIPVAGPPDFTAPQLPMGKGLVYVKLEGLRWPGKKTARAEWKPGHRLSMMQLQAVFTYCTYMSTKVKGIPKLVALPELHMITGYDFGQDMVGALARMGSANDTAMLLDTQTTVELEMVPGLTDQLSAFHAFRVKTSSEADAQARLLGLEPEPSVRNRQKRHQKGACITRDALGRLAPLLYDRLSTEIAAALDTTAKRDAMQDRVDPEVDLDDPDDFEFDEDPSNEEFPAA